MSSRCFRSLLALLGGWLIMLCPCRALAEEPVVERGVKHTVTNLVDQVMVAIDAVRKRPAEAGEPDREDADDAEDARAREATDAGVVPYARTVYKLLRGRFELDGRRVDEGESDEEASPSRVFLKVRPKSRGGYLRCEVRF